MMKRSLFIIAAVFFMGSKPPEPLYIFHQGTSLKKQMPPNEEIIQPSLVLKGSDKSFTFALGAQIWHESADNRYVYVKYPDRRFAAFLTDSIDVIDVEKGERYNIAHNLLYCLDMIDDRTVIAVQRHPTQHPDAHYDESMFALSVITVSNSPFKRTEEVLTAGGHLPDWNRIFTEEDAQQAKRSLYLKGNTLFYQDASGQKKKYTLSKHAD